MTKHETTRKVPDRATGLTAGTKSVLMSVLLFLGTLFVALWCMEAATRLAFHGAVFMPSASTASFIPHPTRAAELPKNSEINMVALPFWQKATINARGFRGPDVAQMPSAGITRILMISDSNSFGSGVADSETLAVHLQKALGEGYEVINFSAPAYSTVQQYVWLLEDGLALKPDLVLLGFTPINDIQTNYQPLQALYQRNSRRPYARLKADGAYEIDNSYMQKFQAGNAKPKLWRRALDLFAGPMVQALAQHAYTMVRGGDGNDPNIWLGMPYLEAFEPKYGKQDVVVYEELWSEAWRATQAIIRDMKNKSEGAGARFAVFSHVAKIEGDSIYRDAVGAAYPDLKIEPGKAEKMLRSFGSESGIPVASYSAGIIESARDPVIRPQLYFSMGDEHLTAKGYAIAGPALAADLKAIGLLKR
jgi:hypothetical protein